MAQDKQYLQFKRGHWYAQIAVPPDLQARLGAKVRVAYLGTASLSIAQSKRWEHINAWKAAFERARVNGGRLSGDEIESIAQEERQRLARLMYANMPQPSDPSETYFRHETDPTSDPVAIALAESITDTLHDLSEGNYHRVWTQLVEACAKDGVPLPPVQTPDGDEIAAPIYPDLDEPQTELAQSLMRAHVAALQEHLAERRGQAAPPVESLNPKRANGGAAARRGKRARVSQLAMEFVASKMLDPDDAWTNQTKLQNESAFRLFASQVSDCPIDAVTRADAIAFKNDIAKLAPTWARHGPKVKKMSFAELLQSYPAEPGKGLKARAIERNVNHLCGLFDWAIQNQHFTELNPFSKIVAKTKAKGSRKRSKWQTWELPELSNLFQSPLLLGMDYESRVRPQIHSMQSAMAWLPLIALYSGMRQGEIAQLRCSDVRRERVTVNGKALDVDYLNVTEEGDGRSLKTDAATRKVSVHPMLVKCGFLDYVAHVRKQGHDSLFPGLKRGGPDGKFNATFTKRFTTHRRRLGVNRSKVSFHSLRGNFATAAENAFVAESNAARVVGHELQSLTYGLYSGGLRLENVKAVVDAVAYPDLDLTHLFAPKKGKARQQVTP